MTVGWARNKLDWAKRLVTRRVRRPWRHLRVVSLSVFGKNPYAEGTVADLYWRLKRNKQLTDEEREQVKALEEAMRVSQSALRMEMPPAVVYRTAYILFAFRMLDNLPRDLRANLDETPVSEARQKIEELLPLASYQRERTSIRLASYAMVMSGIALAITTITLAVTIWSLINTSNSPCALLKLTLLPIMMVA